jgi:hypothetical protein
MVEKTLGTLAVGVLLGIGLLAAADAQNDPPAASPHCLRLATIDRTEAVGDRNILFYLKDRTIYRNDLPHSCPSLKAGRPFMYRLVLDQLCDTDVITMLEQHAFGFVPVESCLLGPFKLTDAAQAETLKASAKEDGNK